MRSLSRQDGLAGPKLPAVGRGHLGRPHATGSRPRLRSRLSSSGRGSSWGLQPEGRAMRRRDDIVRGTAAKQGGPAAKRRRAEGPGNLTVYVKVNGLDLPIRVRQRQLVALAYTNWGPSAPGTLRCTGKHYFRAGKGLSRATLPTVPGAEWPPADHDPHQATIRRQASTPLRASTPFEPLPLRATALRGSISPAARTELPGSSAVGSAPALGAGGRGFKSPLPDSALPSATRTRSTIGRWLKLLSGLRYEFCGTGSLLAARGHHNIDDDSEPGCSARDQIRHRSLAAHVRHGSPLRVCRLVLGGRSHPRPGHRRDQNACC